MVWRRRPHIHKTMPKCEFNSAKRRSDAAAFWVVQECRKPNGWAGGKQPCDAGPQTSSAGRMIVAFAPSPCSDRDTPTGTTLRLPGKVERCCDGHRHDHVQSEIECQLVTMTRYMLHGFSSCSQTRLSRRCSSSDRGVTGRGHFGDRGDELVSAIGRGLLCQWMPRSPERAASGVLPKAILKARVKCEALA